MFYQAILKGGLMAYRSGTKRNKDQKKKILDEHEKRKFIFQPMELNHQITQFQNLLDNNLWDGEILFKGFYGKFNLEYCIEYEYALRQVSDIRSIKFIDTKLTSNHLKKIAQLLLWVKPKSLDLKFESNEIDDLDIEEFLFTLFKNRVAIHTITMTSNPGIFKGHLLSRLKKHLEKEFRNNPILYYHVEINQEFHSLGIIQMLKQETDEEQQIKIQQIQQKISKTNFYEFGLRKCFTDQNSDAFEYLIKQCFHEDRLEILTKLDISSCQLGLFSIFQDSMKTMSKAKGLLELYIQQQPYLEQSYACKALMGDRYHKLRLNVFDISNNQQILEKAFKQLAYGVLMKSCKTIITQGSLTQHLSVLLKIFLLCQSAQEEIDKFKIILQKEGYIPKLNLRELDFSALENYNRHDLTRKLLKTLIYNEFSAIRKFVLANLDIGRIQAYLDAKEQFVNYIKDQEANQLYANFKPKLNEIHVLQQTYRGEIPLQYQLYKSIVFSRIGDLYQIKKVKLHKCFKQTNKEEGLFQMIDEALQEPDIEFSIKELSFSETAITQDNRIHKFFLCCNQVKLEKFEFSNDSLSETIAEDFLLYTQTFQVGQFHTLKVLVLDQIDEMTLDIPLFLKNFIYNPKVRIEQLTLTAIKVSVDEHSILNLNAQINQLGDEYKVSLNSLKFGDFEGGGYLELLKYTYFSEQCRITQLSMVKVQLQQILAELIPLQQQLVLLNNLPYLSELTLDKVEVFTVESWTQIARLFIFQNRFSLKSLYFKNIEVTSEMAQGLRNAFEQLYSDAEQKFVLQVKATDEEIMETINQAFPIKLQKLEFSKCIFGPTDILLVFLTNVFCALEELNLINCENLDETLMKSRELEISNIIANKIDLNQMNKQQVLQLLSDKQYTFNLVKFDQSGSVIVENDNLKWFYSNVIFNIHRQRLQQLFLKSCKISGYQINLITYLINEIKINNSKEFSLRQFNFEDNSQLSSQQLMHFFDTLFESNKEIPLIKGKSMQIEEDSQFDLIKEKQTKIQQLILDHDLNLWKKILTRPNLFQIQANKNLTKIDFTMDFQIDQIKRLYYRIIKSLIIYPGSQVNDITLQKLYLSEFVAQSLIILEENQSYYDLHKDHAEKIQLKVIKIDTLMEQSVNATKQFIQLYLDSPHLKKLSISGFQSDFIENYLQIPIENFQVEELIIEKTTEQLSDMNSQAFIDRIFVNSKISKLKVTQELQIKQIIEDPAACYAPIKQLEIQCKEDEECWFKPIAKYILPKLESFTIMAKEDPNLLINEMDCIQELSLQYPVKLTQEFFDLIMNVRPHLKKLFIKTLWISKPIDEKPNLQQNLPVCELQVEGIEILENNENQDDQLNDQKSVQSRFLFNRNLSFQMITLLQYQLFKSLQELNYLDSLKYLNLNPKLLYNSNNQLNEKFLEDLGNKYIYNIESNLETLLLNQCHLKLAAAKALTKGAQAFRELIVQQNKQSQTHLKLKQFEIYYSLYLGDEGAATICNDILFFEYITIERLAVPVTNWNDNNQCAMNQAGLKWLEFQKEFDRKDKVFQIQHFEIGRNEFLEKESTWTALQEVFLFTDNSPKLEVLYIHFMSQNDQHVEIMTKGLNKYLQQKDIHFRLPLKRLNYQLNTALTVIGWKMISEQFFFHQQVDLEELNLISTMLDGPEKLLAISDSAKQKARMMPGGKLQLHSLITYNISLKDQFSQILSPRPAEYQNTDHIAVDIPFECRRAGLIDGVPEEFGAIVQIVQKTINNVDFISQTQKWKNIDQFKYGTYNLNFIKHFIKLINDTHQEKFTLYISASSLDTLASLYKYTDKEPGNPYPLNLLFQQDFYEYIYTPDSKIRDIIIIPSKFNNNEIVEQQHILYIWEQVKSQQTSINQILIDYTLNDDLVDIMFARGYTERDILQLIRILPPSRIRLENQLTVSFMKGLYSVLWDVPTLQHCYFIYDMDNMLNIGIGYTIREYIYNYKAKTKLQAYVKKIFYKIAGGFVSKANKYHYNESVKLLNEYLQKQDLQFYILCLMTSIWYLICLFVPYSYAFDETNDIKFDLLCLEGISTGAFIIYHMYSILCLLFEGFCCRNILHLTLQIKQEQQEQAIAKSNAIVDLNMKLLASALEKLDFFNDIQFILACYFCEYNILFGIAFFITLFNISIHFYNFVKIIQNKLRQSKNDNKLLSSSAINQFYNISLIGRNAALSEMLNDLAPFNVTVIPNNWFTNKYFPKLAGRSLNNEMRNYLFKFLFEDAPQLILQVIYLILTVFYPVTTQKIDFTNMNSEFSSEIVSNSSLGWGMIFIISLSMLSIIVSLQRFMSINPSILSNADFESLVAEKEKQRIQKLTYYLTEEKKMFEIFEGLYVEQDKNQDELIPDV